MYVINQMQTEAHPEVRYCSELRIFCLRSFRRLKTPMLWGFSHFSLLGRIQVLEADGSGCVMPPAPVSSFILRMIPDRAFCRWALGYLVSTLVKACSA